MTEGSLFGLRFRSNEDLQPGPEELRTFLESPKKPGGRERHGDALSAYLQLLSRVETFDQGQRQGGATQDFRERMLLGVLSHSHLFKPSLKSAVEQYLYHCHQLAIIDLKKPLSFIKSAEEEIGRLNAKKQDDQPKIARLQGMIDQRNKDLEALRKRWRALTKELSDIAVYIRENLAKVQALCESSITVLVSLQLGGEKKGELIEDVKSHFKEQVRDSLQAGPVTKQYLETLKEDVATLAQRLSQQVLEDIYAVTKIYEDIHDHARKGAGRLLDLLPQINAKRYKDLDEDKRLFGRLEEVLLSLVNDLRLEPEAIAPVAAESGQEKILLEKRREMLDHVFALLGKGPQGRR